MYGYEMSGFEYSLFFKYDDMGYVRYDGRSKQLFSLDPSPFWKDDRKIVYVIEDDNKPRENQLIKVQVKEKERKAIQLPNGQLEWVHIKYVGRWEYVNPSKIIPEKKMSHDEYVDFFQIPFKPVSESPDFLNELSYSMAMYTASSHVPGSNQKGGIDAAVLADDKNWKIFGKLMNVIPRDFNSTKSEHFYEKTKKQTPIAPVNSTEVNVTYLEPHEIFVHIPFPLISKVEGGTFYQPFAEDSLHKRGDECKIILKYCSC